MPRFWTPEPLFAGAQVFVVGGGASLKGFDFSRLAGKRVIAINAGGYDLPFADVLFFRDWRWFKAAQDLVLSWAGLLVTVSPGCWAELPERIRLLPVHSPDIPWARTSGQQCVSLALAMGATRIVLLGFDWDPLGSHYHSRYGASVPQLEYTGALATEAWHGYRERAASLAAVIINATPGSLISEFERADLERELAWK